MKWARVSGVILLAALAIAAVGVAVVWLDVPRWAVRATGLSIALVLVLAWLWKLGTPKDALPENHHEIVRRVNRDEYARRHGTRRAS